MFIRNEYLTLDRDDWFEGHFAHVRSTRTTTSEGEGVDHANQSASNQKDSQSISKSTSTIELHDETERFTISSKGNSKLHFR